MRKTAPGHSLHGRDLKPLLVGEFFPGQMPGRVFERDPAAPAVVGDAERQTIALQLEVADVVLTDLAGSEGAF